MYRPIGIASTMAVPRIRSGSVHIEISALEPLRPQERREQINKEKYRDDRRQHYHGALLSDLVAGDNEGTHQRQTRNSQGEQYRQPNGQVHKRLPPVALFVPVIRFSGSLDGNLFGA